MLLSAYLKRVATLILVFSLFSPGLQNIATAGMINSDQVVFAAQSQLDRQQLQNWMAREDVREQLVDMGVDVDSAIVRVDSMTPDEVQQLSAHMHEMPAGSGFLETAVLAFIVLVVLEVTGVTDVLPSI